MLTLLFVVKVETQPTWRFETLTTNGDSYAGDIALDSYDNPHISYAGPKDFASSWRPLKYKWWDGSRWLHYTVDDSEDCGYDSSIALDSHDRPHIGHMTRHFDQIRYANWTGTEWFTEIVYSTSPTGLGAGTSIALDSGDNPHITFSSTSGLMYASRDGTGWNVETVDPEYGRGSYSSLSFDHLNNAHISYYDGPNDRLMYVRWTGTEWSTPDLIDSFPYPWSTSIAIDSFNNPHITYSSPLKHANWNGTDWNIMTVDPIAVEESSMALDSLDRPHISYFDQRSQNLDLKYAWWNGTDWNTETVDSDGWVGRGSSIALDSSENPHISYDYFDPNAWTNDLKYTTTAPLNQPPVADANGPYIGTEGQSTTFDGSGSYDSDGTIVNYEWDFGDGTSGTGVNPIHTYMLAGVYTVILTITDNNGAQDTDTTTAKVHMAGDIDGDGDVDYMDLFKLARAYGSTPDDPNWDANADLNGDNKVDYKDLFILARNYGKGT